MNMPTIKIPSPKFADFSLIHAEEQMSIQYLVEQYFNIVRYAVQIDATIKLDYKNLALSDQGVIADINLESLPLYADMIERFNKIDFESEMLKRIDKLVTIDANTCPTANRDLLAQPISTWHHRWVTVYIWLLMCGHHDEKYFATDAEAIEAMNTWLFWVVFTS